jgi:hypothetical protein
MLGDFSLVERGVPQKKRTHVGHPPAGWMTGVARVAYSVRVGKTWARVL